MNVVTELMLTQPAPLAIWATLLVAATLSVALMASIDGVPQSHLHLLDAVPVLRRLRAERTRRRQDARHLVRYAGELAVASRRAARAATQWHEHAQQAEETTATAWHAWQDAEQRLAALLAACAFTTPADPTPAEPGPTDLASTDLAPTDLAPAGPAPAEHADRARFLHRMVSAAVDRGDLPATALTEPGGWHPRLHPAELERAVQQATVAHRHRLYHQAVRAEKTTRHDAYLARAARNSLRHQATAAIAEATAVRHLASLPEPGPAARFRAAVLVAA
jgi:hypothetical protein